MDLPHVRDDPRRFVRFRGAFRHQARHQPFESWISDDNLARMDMLAESLAAGFDRHGYDLLVVLSGQENLGSQMSFSLFKEGLIFIAPPRWAPDMLRWLEHLMGHILGGRQDPPDPSNFGRLHPGSSVLRPTGRSSCSIGTGLSISRIHRRFPSRASGRSRSTDRSALRSKNGWPKLRRVHCRRFLRVKSRPGSQFRSGARQAMRMSIISCHRSI